jgi:hypothetical protein
VLASRQVVAPGLQSLLEAAAGLLLGVPLELGVAAAEEEGEAGAALGLLVLAALEEGEAGAELGLDVLAADLVAEAERVGVAETAVREGVAEEEAEGAAAEEEGDADAAAAEGEALGAVGEDAAPAGYTVEMKVAASTFFHAQSIKPVSQPSCVLALAK